MRAFAWLLLTHRHDRQRVRLGHRSRKTHTLRSFASYLMVICTVFSHLKNTHTPRACACSESFMKQDLTALGYCRVKPTQREEALARNEVYLRFLEVADWKTEKCSREERKVDFLQ